MRSPLAAAARWDERTHEQLEWRGHGGNDFLAPAGEWGAVGVRQDGSDCERFSTTSADLHFIAFVMLMLACLLGRKPMEGHLNMQDTV